MTILPPTTPKPKPIAIFMPPISGPSTTTAAPTPSPIPVSNSTPDNVSEQTAKKKNGTFPLPKLRLELRDLTHPGAQKFLASVNASDVMAESVQNVCKWLYKSPSEPHMHVPPTRSVTVILRDMDGVAYTTGSDLDSDHKEIHFSTKYIDGIKAERLAAEITGVLVHELVHCYQWNPFGSCNGGLIEGIADFVRLNCDLGPPHWKKDLDKNWDSGYQITAYFLQYLENRYGEGTIRKLNEKLRTQRYEEKPFWTELLGRPVEQLWGDYVKHEKAAKETGSDSIRKVNPPISVGFSFCGI